MIITRTPFRLTLGGGGTDLPSFYQLHGGFILAVGIDKYMFLSVNTPILNDQIYVRYTQTELVDHVDSVKHTLAKEALKFFNLSTGIEIVSIADIPAGTGLGSSSCYLVGLLNALHSLMQSPVSPERLAEEACHIELEVLKKPIGKQDQYMAAFGGLTQMDIDESGKVRVTRIVLDGEILRELENNILLFYLGGQRDATQILSHQDKATRHKDSQVTNSLLEIKDIGFEIRDSIIKGRLRRVGELMHTHWQSKKRLSDSISTSQIDQCYEVARNNGAIGGKVSGAGGGGFLMLYCEEGKAQLRESMRACGLRELDFRFDFEGSKIVFDAVSRDGRLAHLQRQQKQRKAYAASASSMGELAGNTAD